MAETFLDELRARAATSDYFSDPARQKEREADLVLLIACFEEKEKEVARLKKKSEVLFQQNLELTQEMELIRSDFGGEQR